MRSLLVIGSVLALAACGDMATVSQNYIPQAGVPGHADYAKTLGPIPVVTLNSPFPAPPVLTALETHNPRRLRFTADPPASLEGGYRVLLAFDQMPANGGGLYVCRGPLAAGAPAAQPAAPPTTTKVYGAFCLGPALLSEAVATAPRIDSANDPRFPRLMGDLLTALMPYRDPYENSRSWPQLRTGSGG